MADRLPVRRKLEFPPDNLVAEHDDPDDEVDEDVDDVDEEQPPSTPRDQTIRPCVDAPGAPMKPPPPAS